MAMPSLSYDPATDREMYPGTRKQYLYHKPLLNLRCKFTMHIHNNDKLKQTNILILTTKQCKYHIFLDSALTTFYLDYWANLYQLYAFHAHHIHNLTYQI